jgi:hypothetical protein
MNKVQEPIEEQDNSPLGGTILKHPAFGQISAHRISGTASLYGSDFLHRNSVKIDIMTSELRRSLSNDWPHARKELISVLLSEAQWAAFVSSLNAGPGTQCTIRHINCEFVPQLPDPKPRTEQFFNEAKETTERADKELLELAELINASNLSGVKKKEFLSKITSAQRAIGSSVKFVLDQFGEHMEATTEKAKIEIEAYVNDRIQRTGLQALGANDKPFELLENNKP